MREGVQTRSMEGREIDYCVQGGRKYAHTLYISYARAELLPGRVPV